MAPNYTKSAKLLPLTVRRVWYPRSCHQYTLCRSLYLGTLARLVLRILSGLVRYVGFKSHDRLKLMQGVDTLLFPLRQNTMLKFDHPLDEI